MSPPIGQSVAREKGLDTMARARARAGLIPDLLVEAQRVANNVFSGWHGRRKRGVGENFWQFRPYVSGENLASIDWRRSARDDQLYIKDREWQAAHIVWLWVDESPSMLFKSDMGTVSKQSRALVLAFAMAELLARSGERTGWLGVSPPIVSRNAAERLAQSLAIAPDQTEFPANDGSVNMGRYSDVVLISDFLEPLGETETKMASLARAGAKGHVVQIVDPVEQTFPYSGRVEFSNPENGERITAGAAHALKADYSALFAARNARLADAATKLGWTYTLHHTDRLASEALVALHTHMSGNPAGGR